MGTAVQDAAIVLAAVAVVFALAAIAWLSWAIASRTSLMSEKPAWDVHYATLGAAVRQEAEALVAGIRAAISQIAPDAVVALKGSVLTGAVRANSDVDVFVWTKTCDDHDAVARHLLQTSTGIGGTGGPVTHVHSGGKFTLLTTRTPTNRPADISISMDPTDTLLPSDSHLSTRGFFEFVARKNHPDGTVRTSHV